MTSRERQDNWNALADKDALWTILTDPSKKGNKWDRDEFFATGKQEISQVMTDLTKMGIQPKTGLALDFGCGVGRLSQALADYFGEVHGVDISSVMVAKAREFNRHGKRVSYFENVQSDLSLLNAHAYDFIYSNITLQHIPDSLQKIFIAEFCRLLKKDGVAVFEVLHAISWRKLLPNSFTILATRILTAGQPFVPMYSINVQTVKEIVEKCGCRILSDDTRREPSLKGKFINTKYTIRKNS